MPLAFYSWRVITWIVGSVTVLESPLLPDFIDDSFATIILLTKRVHLAIGPVLLQISQANTTIKKSRSLDRAALLRMQEEAVSDATSSRQSKALFKALIPFRPSKHPSWKSAPTQVRLVDESCATDPIAARERWQLYFAEVECGPVVTSEELLHVMKLHKSPEVPLNI